MRAIVTYCLRQRVLVLAVLAAFAAAGVIAFQHLPIEAYPDVTNVQLQVITPFSGHAAEEDERLVTIPLENELNGIPLRASLRSSSIPAPSVVHVVFEDQPDRAFARQHAFERMQQVTLPP